MKLLITGANGFIAKNLICYLRERAYKIIEITRSSTKEELAQGIRESDFIFHLAGVNRPVDNKEFYEGNHGLTEEICQILKSFKRKTPIVFSSSTQAELDNDYGKSKRLAEDALKDLQESQGNPVFIYRLPNVFGKWCKPNYNSVVATFCYNKSQGSPIQINDPNRILNLVYVDDVVEEFNRVLETGKASQRNDISTKYSITIGELAETISAFRNSRENLITEPVGTGLTRALYSTYISYLKPEQFSYKIPKYGDERGVFSEMLKTKDSGQFSFFTAHPGVTRGGHYHHTKTEKFLVVKGKARFNFRHIVTNETYTLETSSEIPEIVETIPGWAHDITNIGTDDMIVLLWANEIFDRNKPDTYSYGVI